MIYDYVIIGGGIIGVSTALQLKKNMPDSRVVILEKEDDVGKHQTSHNSGVIHSGIYYDPKSIKARLCRAGLRETIKFSKLNNVPFKQCGKLIVATDEFERQQLDNLFERSKDNQIDCERLCSAALKEREPNINGNSAILVKSTGIVSYIAICKAMASQFISLGGEILVSSCVTAIKEFRSFIIIHSGNAEVQAKYCITCAGIMTDRLAEMLNIKTKFRLLPFRGEYYKLPSEKNNIVRHLIYPVPNPKLPFLGVHLTRMIDGAITVGPNAVLSLNREDYDKHGINLRDIIDMMSFPGFWRLINNNFKTGISELRNSFFKSNYLELCQKYYPALRLNDLQPHPPGIRAQAVALNGSLIDDFLFFETKRCFLVANAPSPAATSAIPIGKYIVKQVRDRIDKG